MKPFSTHPANEKRIANLQKHAGSALRNNPQLKHITFKKKDTIDEYFKKNNLK